MPIGMASLPGLHARLYLYNHNELSIPFHRRSDRSARECPGREEGSNQVSFGHQEWGVGPDTLIISADIAGQYQREVLGEMTFSAPRTQIELDRSLISSYHLLLMLARCPT